MFELSDFLFSVKNLFEKLDGLTSEQSYRRVVDNIEDILEAYDEGTSPQEVYDSYWN